MSPVSSPGATRTRSILGRALPWVVYAGLLFWDASELARHHANYRSDPIHTAALAVRAVALVCAICVPLLAARAARAARPIGRDWIRLAACPGAAVVLATLAQPLIGELDPRWLTRSVFFSGLAIALSGWVLQLTRRGSAPRQGDRDLRPRSRADVVVANILLTLVLLEAGVVLIATISPTPLVSGPELPARLAAMRDEPGRLHFGTPLNSGGYADDEFYSAGPGDFVVAVLADSFGIGVVPQRYNFVSVAEAALVDAIGDHYDRVALHNFGVPGVALNTYRYVYETQARAFGPELVVVCVFVGNDILEGYTFGTRLVERYRLQEWYVWNVARKLFSLAKAPASEVEATTGVAWKEGAGAAFPAAQDPSLEIPTYAWPVYAEIELRRIEVTNPDRASVERRYRQFFRGLEYFHDRLGDRLLVAILPDEFQVNDELYARLSALRPGVASYPRTYPQERIRAFCARRGAHCLDVLGALREAEQGGRTYHLRDSHFNARGNRVVGELLARAVEERAQALRAR